MIGLFINFIKYNNSFNFENYTFICSDLNDAKQTLLNFLTKEFLYLKIDFPLLLEDFEYIFLKNEYINTNVFTYKIFINNTWEEPWELQDIYTDVLDILQEIEYKKDIDFSEITDWHEVTTTAGLVSHIYKSN